MPSPHSVDSVPSRLRDRRLLPPHRAPELVGKRVGTELAEVVGVHRGVSRDGARGSPCPHHTRWTLCLRVSETAAAYRRTALLNWWENASTRSSPRWLECTEGFRGMELAVLHALTTLGELCAFAFPGPPPPTAALRSVRRPRTPPRRCGHRWPRPRLDGARSP